MKSYVGLMGHKSLTDAPFPESHAFTQAGSSVIRSFPLSLCAS